jgi:hypothetical protein
MSYYNDLACELRMRKCTEKQVAEVLETVKEGVTASDSSPEHEFGTAKEYAAQYEGSRKAAPGQRALMPFGMLGILCVVAYAIWPGKFSIEIPFVQQFAGMIALIILLAVGSIVGSIVENRLPAGFSPPVEVRVE